jgi:formylglycine-generating enzyme required for sulfatase activity
MIAIFVALVLICLAPAARADDRVLRPGDTFRDCEDCPEMVVIPAGRFVMGAPVTDRERQAAEGPPHEVTIPAPLAVGRFEVTRGEFAAFVDARGWATPDACTTYEDGNWDARPGRTWRDPGFPVDDTHPVNCVTFEDVLAYLDWLSTETGEPYRLLTEAEWEYAARAGSASRYFFGDDPASLCSFANGADLSAKEISPDWTWTSDCSDGHPFSAPVGSYQPNAFGLYDMTGNVWEWVSDCYHDSYEGAPTDGTSWTGPPCDLHVSRGGGLFDSPAVLRVTFRGKGAPGTLDFESGFRVARSITEAH